jgi:hypothetical protein
MLVLPYAWCFKNPACWPSCRLCRGRWPRRASDPLLFGAALTVGIALITQMGEQADYLRFMPEKTAAATASAGGPACCWAGRAGCCPVC